MAEAEPINGRLDSVELKAKPTWKGQFFILRLIWKSKGGISVVYLRLLPCHMPLGFMLVDLGQFGSPSQVSSPLKGED